MNAIDKQRNKLQYENWINKVIDENEIQPEDETRCEEIASDIVKKEKSINILLGEDKSLIITKGILDENDFVNKINSEMDRKVAECSVEVKVTKAKLDELLKDDPDRESKKQKIKEYNIDSSKKFFILAFVDTVEEKVKLQKIYDAAKHGKKLLEGYNKINTSLIIVTTGSKSYGGSYCARLEVKRTDIQYFGDVINYKPFEKIDNNEIKGYTINVKLIDLIAIYNRLGDRLFQKNVRLGIADTMDVEKYMCKTLEEHPRYFWYYNNGITIALYNKDFKFNKFNEIILQNEIYDDVHFSIINGAQTISTAARYYYELKGKLNDELCEEEKEIINKKIDDIKENAFVLMRLICIPEESPEVDKITVALNRQKPIRQEDMAYTLPIIKEINDYVANIDNASKHSRKFRIVKRGEEQTIPEKRCMTPFIFGKIMATCNFKPDYARNWSVTKLLKYDNDEFHEPFLKFNIDDNTEEQSDGKNLLFEGKLNAVGFVFDFYQCLDKIRLKDNKEKEAVIKNLKWTIISFYLLIKNGENNSDFSDFESQLTDDDMKAFAEEVADYLISNMGQDITKFYKSTKCYEKLVEKRSDTMFTKFIK